MSTLPAGWGTRAADMRDVDGVVELSNARSHAFYGENQTTRENVVGWWTQPRFDLMRDLRLVFDERGELAGIATAENPGEPYATIGCSGVAHPRYQDDQPLWDWLHAWALGRTQELAQQAAEGIRVVATSNAAREDSARAGALSRAGFAPVRVANHMRIELAEPIPSALWPERIAVRTVDIAADLRAIVLLFLEAWRDHWGFVVRPFDQVLADWRQWITSEGARFDPTLWFLAVEDEEVVGISLCDSHIAGDESRGFVAALGVRPAWRKRGIALALLRHTFAEFRRRGYTAVELDMDSENLTGALRVYERAGMRAIRQTVFYEKELRPGVDLATRRLER